MKNKLKQLALKAKASTHELSLLSPSAKNKVLKDLAQALIRNKTLIQKANKKDVALAVKKGLSTAMIDRLVLDDKRIVEMKNALLDIVKLPDPVGEIAESRSYNQLEIKKVRIPLGVICIIYESRPNVTIDAASLCFKSGNAVILRGGSEAFHSNTALVKIIWDVLKKHRINPNVVSLVPFTDRQAMIELIKLDRQINLVIPRGGENLMKFIAEHSKIPVIKHDKGVCCIFVDESARAKEALKIIENAKVQRPGVCNAVEMVYIHQKIAKTFLPALFETLSQKGVELRGDHLAKKIAPKISRAKSSDFGTEFLDLILSVKIVQDVHDAIKNIIQYSSNHTESIITENKKNAELFVKSLHSSCVMINTSTRFNDGGQLGLGAEIGISTTKLHAYGPMGLRELTAQKLVVQSRYKTRS